MSGHEQAPSNDPDDGNRDVPAREQLEPGEIDLTGAVSQEGDLRDVIGDAIVEARDGELPDWGARTVARYLASHIQHSRTSALHQFATIGRGDPEAAMRELSELYQTSDLAPEYRDWMDRLGTYFVALGRDGRDPRGPGHRPEIRKGIEEHGSAFAAFLQLPDVTEDNALELFNEAYFRSFGSMDAIAQHVGETHDLWELHDDATLDHLASPDPNLLLALARERWDIVEHEGRYHLFEK